MKLRMTFFLASIASMTFLYAQINSGIVKQEVETKSHASLLSNAGFNDWHIYGGTNANGSAWENQDGTFHLKSNEQRANAKGGDLVTKDAYENFELELEWKIAKGGNSGIIFLVQDDPQKYNATYLTGLEMQVLDNIDAHDNKKENHLAGSLYDLIGTAKNSKPKAVGQWNKAKIILEKGHLTLFLNGIKTAKTQLWTSQWNNLVKNSKFVEMPDFGKFKSGHIALQDHGDEVSYRNIKIRNLLP